MYNDVEQAHGQEQIFHIKRGLSEKNTAGIETVYLPEIDSDLGTNYGTQ